MFSVWTDRLCIFCEEWITERVYQKNNGLCNSCKKEWRKSK